MKETKAKVVWKDSDGIVAYHLKTYWYGSDKIIIAPSQVKSSKVTKTGLIKLEVQV